MNKKKLLNLTIGLLIGSCISSSAYAATDEITLESINAEKQNLQTAKTVEALPENYNYDVDMPTDNMFLSSNADFRISQAMNQTVAPTVKLDAGIKKDAGTIAVDEASDEVAEVPFIQRITKEDYRYKPLQVFNKNGIQFEHGPVKSFKMSFFYFGTDTLTWPYQDTVTSKWKDGAAELTTITKFRNDKTAIRFSYNFLRDFDGHPSGFMERVSELGLVHEFNKHQQVHIGQTWRLPIGVEGYLSTFNTDLPTRAMIGRTFGNTRSFGVRNIGNYKYMDYDIGVYDSTRYWRHFGDGLDFTGWVNFKPLANLDSNKYGKLTLGTGLNAGRANDPYTIWGAYVGYDYKRFHNKFEYAHANGYNANTVQSTAKAEGFYDTMIFDITKKLSVVGRFDYYNSNLLKANCVATEYSGGISYKLHKNVKLLAAYTYRHHDNGSYSNAVSLQARIKI